MVAGEFSPESLCSSATHISTPVWAPRAAVSATEPALLHPLSRVGIALVAGGILAPVGHWALPWACSCSPAPSPGRTKGRCGPWCAPSPVANGAVLGAGVRLWPV